MRGIGKRLLGGATAVALAVSMWAAPAAAADTQVTVTQDSAGNITLSRATVPTSSLVAFKMNSSYRYTDLQIIQLHNGVTLQQFDVKAAERDVLSTAGAASAWLIQNVSFFGGLTDTDATYGGEDHPDTIEFRKVMPVGAYQIVQMRPVGNVKASTKNKTLTVNGSGGTTSPYSPQSLRVNNVGGTDHFFIDSVNGPIRMIATTTKNQAGAGWPAPPRELHDFHLVQVAAGTTEAQVTSWITAGGPSPLVANGGRFNFGILSGQGYADVVLKPRDAQGNVRPGRYVLTSLQRDVNSGQRHFEEGNEGEFILINLVA